jgi:tripartite-type tricarboxylate transporter receptor subunit TctC
MAISSRVSWIVALLPLALITAQAQAQPAQYPNRPIRVISGFPPGSSVDVLARFMASRLAERLGQHLMIDNRPGASGTIGADIAARATPDGYTLFINWMFATLPLSLTQIRAGKVKAYGISAPKRSALVPNVPPIAGTVPGFDAVTWWSFSGPAGLPGPILARLNSEITGILNQPESAQRLSAEGAEPWPLSSEAFTKVLQSELEKWTRVARDIGVRAD